MPEAQAAQKVSISGLYALTPESNDSSWLIGRVAAALDGGVTAVQYRNKSTSSSLKLAQAGTLRSLCADRGVTFIVNDDIELAAAVGADGVHLGRDDPLPATARKLLGPDAMIGVSCYDSLERAESALRAGAGYIAFGSFFLSRVKPQARRAPIALLAAARARWSVPIVAIGGITAANARPLLAAGADALAVISSLFDAADNSDVTSAARAFTALFGTAIHRAS